MKAVTEQKAKASSVGSSFKDSDDGTQNDLSTLLPHSKIKMKLYPVDKDTRIGLEKEGLNPYLELTLRLRKKICTVLERLQNKWGGTEVAVGDPVLFPYDNHQGDTSRLRSWTMNDLDISARDVFVSVGRPADFRLRYGWVSSSEPETTKELNTSSIPTEACLQSEVAEENCNFDGRNADKKEVQLEENSNSKLISDAGQNTHSQLGQSTPLWNDLSQMSFGAILSEISSQAKLKPRSTENNGDSKAVNQWDDSLINISIGGIFSESSLQGKFNNGKTGRSILRDESKSTQIFSDSLDAFIAAQTRPPHEAQTSILDGEDTCHAFSLQNRKRVSAFVGNSGDGGSKPFKFPKLEIETKVGVSEDQARPDPPRDLFRSSPTFNDDRSLDFTSIKWGDSLGPFDLGLSSSRKLTK